MKKRGLNLSFIISNTDRSNRPRMHQWRILDLHPKKEMLFFESFALSVLKDFVIEDDKKLITKILHGLEKSLTGLDSKLTIIKATLSRSIFERVTEK